ncbi:MAG: AarF/UbiB family protein [Myxococcota bacterium]
MSQNPPARHPPPEARATPPLRRRRAAFRFTLRRLGALQTATLLGWLLTSIAIELLGRLSDLRTPGPQRPRRRQQRRERRAAALVGVLGRLKGPFAKLGQFAALRVDVLSEATRERLATLQDRVPPLPFPEIRAVVEAELGAPLEAHFASFEPEPIGAASIAQAHRARLPGGERVVVKVQYPWLASSLPVDLAVLRLLVAIWSRSRPSGQPEGRRLFEEFARSLREELDFEHEAALAAEVARNLADDPAVVVPRVIASHSRRRVLVMSHHEAVPILDREALRRLGVEPGQVMEILARAYAKQIFVDGLFHADPHPGNLFVVDEPSARERPRILFVDFGLSRRLTPELRQELRRGAYALLAGDPGAFLAGMERMSMIAPGARADVEAAVRSMFDHIRGEEKAPLSLAGDRVLALKDQAKTLLLATPGLKLPADLLLYAKTLSYLFALGAELAPEVDLMRISVPYLLRFLAEKEEEPARPGP